MVSSPIMSASASGPDRMVAASFHAGVDVLGGRDAFLKAQRSPR